MIRKLPFIDLTMVQQMQACARFCDAKCGDGYLYELDGDGIVLCRQRPTLAQVDG